MHCKAKNAIFSILWDRLGVLVPPLRVLVALLDGYPVGTTWELLSLLWDERGLSTEHCEWCRRDAWHRKRFSLRVLNLILRLLIHEVPGGCSRWKLGRFVIVHHQNKLNPEIARTRVYISLLPAEFSILFSSGIEHSTSILRCLEITRCAQNNASHSKTYPITYTTLYVHAGLPSAACTCIIMLMPRM